MLFVRQDALLVCEADAPALQCGHMMGKCGKLQADSAAVRHALALVALQGLQVEEKRQGALRCTCTFQLAHHKFT